MTRVPDDLNGAARPGNRYKKRSGSDVERACAAALAGLPKMYPYRLRALLSRRAPSEIWEALRRGRGQAVPLGAEAAPCRPDPAAGAVVLQVLESGECLRPVPAEVIAQWHDSTARMGPAHGPGLAGVLASATRRGMDVTYLGDERFPERLRGDLEGPAVLWVVGFPGVLATTEASVPSVAIVGTRGATYQGREVARGLANELAEAGVNVVSGLALGIDAAAHQGVLSAWGSASLSGAREEGGQSRRPMGVPLAVVAGGLDIPYPPQNAGLWRSVAGNGAVMSEHPPGIRPHARRFAERNRIIAGLSDLVVVVESRSRGGAMLTVEAAERRGIPVCAVPGSVRNPAAQGTNALLVDGCTPVRDTEDVLVALALDLQGRLQPGAGLRCEGSRRAAVARGPGGQLHDERGRVESLRDEYAGHMQPPGEPGRGAKSPLSPRHVQVLEALDWGPTPTEVVQGRTGLALGAVAAALEDLEELGACRREAGCWERLREY